MADPKSLKPAIFFDRDGVLHKDIGYAHRPADIEWSLGVAEAIKSVNEAGAFAFVVTNQSGVARGRFGERDVRALHDWMSARLESHGARIDAFEYCPYHRFALVPAYRRDSFDRKPNPGMLLSLMNRFPVDPARAVLIGDKSSDLAAARAAGIQGMVYRGGYLNDLVLEILAEWQRRRSTDDD